MIRPIRNKSFRIIISLCVLYPLCIPAADCGETAVLSPPVSSIRRAVEHIRKKTFTRAVKTGVKTSEQITEVLKEQFKKELPEALLLFHTVLYREFDLVPEGYDLKKGLINLLSGQIGGYYNPKEKTFYISEKSMLFRDMIIAHELTHALQDCSLDLDRIIALEDLGFSSASTDRNDDIARARLSFFEGEAQMVMSLYVQKGYASVPDVTLKDVLNLMFSQMQMNITPRAIADQLMYPYINGHTFIQEFHSRDRWKSIESMYKHLPRSSEQISHPEKYIAGEDPVIIRIEGLRSLQQAGWKKTGENSMGEFMTYQAVKSLTGDFAKGIRASCGWGGDTFTAFSKEDETLIVWYTAWDTAKDSSEFFTYLGEGIKRNMSAGSASIIRQDSGLLHIKDSPSVLIRKSGKDVVYVSCSEDQLLLQTDTFLKGVEHLSWDEAFPADRVLKKNREKGK